MKLLVFAHTPPPHHGQSYMVELMLKNFGGDWRQPGAGEARGDSAGRPYGIQCYHVNARFSRSLEDVGEFQGVKILLILWYCLTAIWCRYRYGVTNFYYVPAPGKRVAVYRDWLVMFLCRPFFERLILHWHAAGLAKWLETCVQMRTRSLTYHWYKHADLSIVISNYNVADAEKLRAQTIRVVGNGIPDPCPEYAARVLPVRAARLAVRRQLLARVEPDPADLKTAGSDPHLVRVLFIAHCSREKGFFAAAHGVRLANAALAAENSPLRFKLVAAGIFVSHAEQVEFERLLTLPEFAGTLAHLGFVAGAEKDRALREADLFCFPTAYLGENQPVNLIEAMAYGLPILTTRWRSLPEMLPAGYPGLVDDQAPDQIAAQLCQLMNLGDGRELREHFTSHFTLEHHLKNLSAAMRSLETPLPGMEPAALLPEAGAIG
jgi:glycosyltransferase involved in cell wall biosynthesis